MTDMDTATADALLNEARRIGKLDWLPAAARDRGYDYVRNGSYCWAAVLLAREGVTFRDLCRKHS